MDGLEPSQMLPDAATAFLFKVTVLHHCSFFRLSVKCLNKMVKVLHQQDGKRIWCKIA